MLLPWILCLCCSLFTQLAMSLTPLSTSTLLKREALHLKHYPSISTVAFFIPLFCFSAFFHNSYHLTYYKFRVLIYHLSPSSIISSRGQESFSVSALSPRLRIVPFSCSYTLPAHLGRCSKMGSFEGLILMARCPSPPCLSPLIFRPFCPFYLSCNLLAV